MRHGNQFAIFWQVEIRAIYKPAAQGIDSAPIFQIVACCNTSVVCTKVHFAVAGSTFSLLV